MSLKLLSFNIEESTHEKIKKMCEIEGIKQTDFINRAIDCYLEVLACESNGGKFIELVPPCIYKELPEATQKQVVELMNEFSYQFTKITQGKMVVPLDIIKYHVVESFNLDNETKQKMSKRYCEYLGILEG